MLIDCPKEHQTETRASSADDAKKSHASIVIARPREHQAEARAEENHELIVADPPKKAATEVHGPIVADLPKKVAKEVHESVVVDLQESGKGES